jgi:hypothetical protein
MKAFTLAGKTLNYYQMLNPVDIIIKIVKLKNTTKISSRMGKENGWKSQLSFENPSETFAFSFVTFVVKRVKRVKRIQVRF